MTAIKKISKVICVLSRICKIISAIGFIFVVLSFALLLSVNKDYFSFAMTNNTNCEVKLNAPISLSEIVEQSQIDLSQIGEDIEIGDNYIKFSTGETQFEISNYQLGVSLWIVAIKLASDFAVFMFIDRLFKNLSLSDTVFNEANYVLTKDLGVVLLINLIVPPVMSDILNSVMRMTTPVISLTPNFNLETLILILAYVVILKVFGIYVKNRNNENNTGNEDEKE